MPLLRPFPGLRPRADSAAQVIAPPYDVLNTEEARERVRGKPLSFLHISKPEIDLPAGTDPYSPAVYAKAKSNFDALLNEGVLTRDPGDYFYIYRLTMGAHSQFGVVAAASVAAYEENRIRRHEFTRPDKEDDRVRQIDALNAQTGPVFLTYRRAAVLDAVVDAITAGRHDVDVSADDGVRHTLWVVRDKERIESISAMFDAIPALYIADGHHRAAAAARVAERRRAANPEQHGSEAYNFFLAVAFPDNQTQILDYNRVVVDLNGLTPAELLRRLNADFGVEASAGRARPEAPAEFGMYVKGRWYRLRVKSDRVPANDPVRSLDVSLLQELIIKPILGIDDPRRDKRIDFVGGIRGLEELERRVNSGEMACAFALHATSVHDMMAVADAGEVMPPKSTWFEPKLADGLVSHVLD